MTPRLYAIAVGAVIVFGMAATIGIQHKHVKALETQISVMQAQIQSLQSTLADIKKQGEAQTQNVQQHVQQASVLQRHNSQIVQQTLEKPDRDVSRPWIMEEVGKIEW